VVLEKTRTSGRRTLGQAAAAELRGSWPVQSFIDHTLPTQPGTWIKGSVGSRRPAHVTINTASHDSHPTRLSAISSTSAYSNRRKSHVVKRTRAIEMDAITVREASGTQAEPCTEQVRRCSVATVHVLLLPPTTARRCLALDEGSA